MRGTCLAASIVLITALCGTAAAQSALEGPLAAPDAPATPPPKAKKAPNRKPGHPAHAATHASAKSVNPEPSTAQARPAATKSASSPEDPLSFGMKWNGSNDDARETRIQNYNGNAAGTGAEVGLKLHF